MSEWHELKQSRSVLPAACPCMKAAGSTLLLSSKFLKLVPLTFGAFPYRESCPLSGALKG
jgi:hypothetical protein